MNKNTIPLIIIAIAVICFGLAVLALVYVPESYRTFPAKNMDGPHDWHDPAEKETTEVIKRIQIPTKSPTVVQTKMTTSKITGKSQNKIKEQEKTAQIRMDSNINAIVMVIIVVGVLALLAYLEFAPN